MHDACPKVLEYFLLSKRGEPDGGEDGIYIGSRYIVVIDGATSKTEWYKEPREEIDFQERPGVLAKEAIMSVLPFAPSYHNPMEFFRFINDAVAKVAFNSLEKPQASVIAYSCASNEVWSYGDCQCLIDGVLHDNKKEADIVLAKKRSEAIGRLLEDGATENQILCDDKGRDAILNDLKSSALLANRLVPGGYPVLNGSRLVDDLLVIYPVPANAQVVLATDGYPILEASLESSERRLTSVIEEDPLMISSVPQTKGVYAGQVSFDDRAYVRFSTEVYDGTQ